MRKGPHTQGCCHVPKGTHQVIGKCLRTPPGLSDGQDRSVRSVDHNSCSSVPVGRWVLPCQGPLGSKARESCDLLGAILLWSCLCPGPGSVRNVCGRAAWLLGQTGHVGFSMWRLGTSSGSVGATGRSGRHPGWKCVPPKACSSPNSHTANVTLS